MRFCACGCGESLNGLRADAKYASAACRARDYKRRAELIPAGFNPVAFWTGYHGVTHT